MALIPFGAYLPDLPTFNNPGATVASGVLPKTGGGYEPLPSLSAVSAALTARCRGAVSMTDINGATYNYAGDATKLYSASATAVTDLSKVGGYANGTDDNWEFAKWGNACLATNYADAVQTVTLGASPFADLITSTRKPKARHIGVDSHGFVFLGNVTDAVDGPIPYRVWWSALENAADFDPSAATQSDTQDLVGDGGDVQRIIEGGDYMLVFQQRAIQRFDYQGGAVIFNRATIERARGAVSAGTVVAVGRLVFYLGDDGFYVCDGTGSTAIGAGKIDRTFWAEVDQQYLGRITASIDPRKKIVAWSYATTSGAGTPNKIIAFNWVDQRWSTAEVSAELLFPSLSQGYTLEQLDAITTDLDALPLSLDSPAWMGGVVQLGAFDTSNKFASFSGANLAATLETAEVQLVDGERALLTSAMPMVDGGTLSMAMGTRNRINDSVTYGSSVSQDTVGRCSFLSNARYHRARVSIAAGGTWSNAQGVDGLQFTGQGAF